EATFQPTIDARSKVLVKEDRGWDACAVKDGVPEVWMFYDKSLRTRTFSKGAGMMRKWVSSPDDKKVQESRRLEKAERRAKTRHAWPKRRARARIRGYQHARWHRRSSKKLKRSRLEGSGDAVDWCKACTREQRARRLEAKALGERSQATVVAQFPDYQPEKFSGQGDPRIVDEWIQGLEMIFEVMDCPDRYHMLCAQIQLTVDARLWWNAYWSMRPGEKDGCTWDQFKELIREKYYPSYYRVDMERQFLALVQGTRSVDEYEREFTRLGAF
ncbi:Unknown protein, partial [Striga hermonthica]